MSKQRKLKLVIKILTLITLLTNISFGSKNAKINENIKYVEKHIFFIIKNNC